MIRTLRTLLPFLLATPATAQSLNVDVGLNGTLPVPAASYAGAGLAGTWNAAPVPANALPLVGLDGFPIAATLTSSGGFLAFDFDNPATGGDAGLLLDDCQDLGGPSSSATWTFSGLANGEYTVFTYAWAPDNAGFRTTVSVPGSIDAAQSVGGAWGGAQALGVTHARHRVVVAAGTLAIQLDTTVGFGSLNGFQLVRGALYPPLCAGDGTGAACPCANTGASGRGCANSVDPGGGLLAAAGAASVGADTLLLSGSGMPSSSALYFQGSSAVAGGAGAAFGDGLRCAGGSVIRLGTKTNAGGASQYPEGGDLPVSVRGAVSAGDVRVYQVWYRNAAAFCTADTFNLTNGVRVEWGT